MSYPVLALAFLALAAAVAVVATRRRRLGPRWWAVTGLTVLALMVLTAVFDNLMIAADLFRYNEELLVGWYLGLAPVEDFAWPLAAGLLLPSLWELLHPAPASPAGPWTNARTDARNHPRERP
ncbi:lycopene cyclase domain-containing protein [Citricoccus sp.]|uniref:lycopene cyclase domain-containing protein n=1 Tax=Citricoccus sp. TaxID=1978372 RepID=UPI00261E29CE|nr:lycopene cyclase domain-containing protein [Citricoccus sp.]HRO29252.1 lycopene cyclase domain-containing protein [Citricoccus sp.]HRO92715.1 lycopene cyclase domain-containing protein [Citricoccus sp.]